MSCLLPSRTNYLNYRTWSTATFYRSFTPLLGGAVPYFILFTTHSVLSSCLMETAVWIRAYTRLMVRARGNSVNATAAYLYSIVCPICIGLPYVPYVRLASISPRAVVTAHLSCIVRPIRARHYAAVVPRVAFWVMAGTTSKYYSPLSWAGAVVYPPRYPTRAASTLEPLVVLAGTR